MTTEQALKLYIVLSRAHRAAAEADKREIRRHGLGPSEFAVLELLMHKGPQPIQQIAARVLLTSGSMTYVVSRLEQAGLVRRTMSEKDRRVFHAELTEAGRALIAGIFPAHAEHIRGMMDVLPAEDAQALTNLLERLGKAIEDKTKKGDKDK